MRLDKTKKRLLNTYVVFAFLLLVIMPLIHFFLIEGTDVFSRLNAAFLSQKLSIAAALMAFVLIIMVIRTNLRFNAEKREWRYFFWAVILFLLSFYTFSDLDSVIRQGVSVDMSNSHPVIDFDSQRFFSVREFNTIDNKAGLIDLDGIRVKRALSLYDLAQDREISFIVYSKDFTKANFSLTVNDFTFNVSGLNHDSDLKNLKFKVDKTMLAYENNVEIQGTGLAVVSESLFSKGRTFIFSGEEGPWLPVEGEALIYFRIKNSLLFDILFKFGILFRIIGAFFLFIFAFGSEFIRKCRKRYKKEVLLAFIFTLLLFLTTRFF